MAIKSGNIIKASDIIDYINTNVVAKINSSIYWYKGRLPNGIDTNRFSPNIFSPDSTVPALKTDINIDTGKIINASNLSSSIEMLMMLWCEVRKANYTHYSWGRNNGGTPPKFVKEQATNYCHFSYGEGNFMNRLPVLKDIGRNNKNKLITAAGFQQYVDALYNFWLSANTEDIVYTDSCHSNCHGSCHGSKGW